MEPNYAIKEAMRSPDSPHTGSPIPPSTPRGRVRKVWAPLYISAFILTLIGIVMLIVSCCIPQVPRHGYISGTSEDTPEVKDICSSTGGCNAVNNSLIQSLVEKFPTYWDSTERHLMQNLGPYSTGTCEKEEHTVGTSTSIYYILRPVSTLASDQQVLTFNISCSASRTFYTYDLQYSLSLSGFHVPGRLATVPNMGEPFFITQFVSPFVAFLFCFLCSSLVTQLAAIIVACRNPPVEKVVLDYEETRVMCGGCDEDGCCCDASCSTCEFSGCNCCICTPTGHLHRMFGAIISFQVFAVVVAIIYIGFCGGGTIPEMLPEGPLDHFTCTGAFYALIAVLIATELIALALHCVIYALKLW